MPKQVFCSRQLIRQLHEFLRRLHRESGLRMPRSPSHAAALAGDDRTARSVLDCASPLALWPDGK